MDYQIIWTETALDDLRDLVCYIADDDATTAQRFGERMIRKVEKLASFPRIGRKVPEHQDDQLREVILTPYRLIYELSDRDHSIIVLRVWHGARGEPDIPQKP